jgi:hypothetical protein
MPRHLGSRDCPEYSMSTPRRDSPELPRRSKAKFRTIPPNIQSRITGKFHSMLHHRPTTELARFPHSSTIDTAPPINRFCRLFIAIPAASPRPKLYTLPSQRLGSLESFQLPSFSLTPSFPIDQSPAPFPFHQLFPDVAQSLPTPTRLPKMAFPPSPLTNPHNARVRFSFQVKWTTCPPSSDSIDLISDHDMVSNEEQSSARDDNSSPPSRLESRIPSGVPFAPTLPSMVFAPPRPEPSESESRMFRIWKRSMNNRQLSQNGHFGKNTK